MRKLVFTLISLMLVPSFANAAVKWNNPSKNKVKEGEYSQIADCTHLGRVEASKNVGSGDTYSLKETKKRLAGKAEKLGGNTFVMIKGWDAERRLTLDADVYKCG